MNINIDISLFLLWKPDVLQAIISRIVFLRPLFCGLAVKIDLRLLFLGGWRRFLGLDVVGPTEGEVGGVLGGGGGGGGEVLSHWKWGGLVGGQDERPRHIVDLLQTLCVLVTVGKGGLGCINWGLHISHLGTDIGVSGVRVGWVCFR